MKKVFIVLASRCGYSKTLYGIYTDIALVETRVNELKNENFDLEDFDIKEVLLNDKIEYQF